MGRFYKKCNSSGIRQKAESQNGCFKKKQSTPKFPENKRFLPPDTYMHVCVSGGKKCLFFGNFGVLCFLEAPVLKFALLPFYRQVENFKSSQDGKKQIAVVKCMIKGRIATLI